MVERARLGGGPRPRATRMAWKRATHGVTRLAPLLDPRELALVLRAELRELGRVRLVGARVRGVQLGELLGKEGLLRVRGRRALLELRAHRLCIAARFGRSARERVDLGLRGALLPSCDQTKRRARA